jgi:hypothetical protein
VSTDFQSRLLYEQTTSAIIQEESPVTVNSTIYALRFLYPGASNHTTGRVRITCTYRDDDQFEAHAGVIERWTDKGWIILDDYTGDVYGFHSMQEFRKRLLEHTQSFILGIPLTIINENISDKSLNISVRKKFDLKTTTTEKKQKKEDKYKIEEKKPTTPKDHHDDDDDDLDWL